MLSTETTNSTPGLNKRRQHVISLTKQYSENDERRKKRLTFPEPAWACPILTTIGNLEDTSCTRVQNNH